MAREIRPRKIRVDASSVCQLNCPSCPNASGAIQPTIGSGFLKLNDFRDLIEKNPSIREIELSNYGEIFLNPDLLKIIEYAHSRKILLRANDGVNLNNVHPNVLDGLVKYAFRSMTCSLDGATSETYSQYRVGGDFESVVKNIREINALKRRYRSRYPLLKWQFVVFGFNQHEIPMARELAKELDMGFRLKLSWDPLFSPLKDRELVRKEIGFASREEYEEKHRSAYLGEICHQLWEGPQINWDGKILGCCRNFWGEFGKNAFADGFLESLNSEKIKYAREMLVGKKAPRHDIPCATCNIYLRRKALGGYLKRGAPHLAWRFIRDKIRLRARLRKWGRP